MKNNRILTLIVALQFVTILSLWTGNHLPVAQAQVPDAGAQRIEIINELKSTNTQLEKIATILASGKLQVQAVPADQKK